MMRKFYLLICLLIVQMAVYGQTRTLDFANVSSDPNGTRLGTTSFTQTTAAQESWTFTMAANSPSFWSYADQTLWLQSGDPTATPLGNAKTSIRRADGQNFNFRTINFLTFSQDQYLRIEGKKAGTVKNTQNVHLADANVAYPLSFTGWTDLDEVVLTITTNALFANNTSAADFYVGITSFTYDPSPRITTGAVGSVAATSALFNGNLTSSGFAAIAEKGFVYSTSSNPTIAGTKRIVAGAALGAFTYSETTLSSSTTYHVRAYATNSVGTSYGADQQFTTSTPVAAPTVTALSPTSGPTGGGTSVTITGTNFSGTTAVTFGATAATGFTVNSATQITATAPAGTGTVDVRITTSGGTSATSASDQFTYVARPTVTALSPTSGPTVGGTSVTITGTSFSGTTAVTFGATAATGFTVNSATQITATAPAGTGTVDIRITTTGGTSATSASDQFTYVAAPTVTAAKINISSGSGTGGAFKIGDVVTAIWNNSAIGDNNSGITAVTMDFSQFGGGSAVAATNSSGTWTATYTIVAGTIDATNRNISVTATNSAGPTTTTGTNNAIVDNLAPVVTDANISINGASGTGGTYKIGDVITATWNNTAAGDNNMDIISSVTINFSQFGGGSAVAATNSSGTWTATYALAAGAINATNRNVAVTATDNAGNTKTTVDGSNATVDNQAPSAVISSTAGASGGSTSTSPIPFTVTFSETVTGFVAGDITPGNATISGFSGSGTTYTFNATPTANGAVTISIAANVALDAAGNGNTAASQFSITYGQAVTATPVVASPSNGSLITTTAPDYTGTATAGATVTVYVDGASLGTTTATGGNWSLTQPAALAQGSHTVYATAQVTGNAVSANSTTNTFTVDSQRPSVAITSTAGATGGSTSTSPIPFTVTFSETVTGFVAGDITPGNATISGFSGSGTTYTFNATPTANGAVMISIAANVALDAAGNGNTAASQFSITYTQASQITASAGTFPSALSTTYGTASTSTSVTVSGTGLTTGITATPSSTANFEVSADGTNFGTSAIIGTSGTVSGTVYVRLTATAAANTNITGNITLTSTGTNSPVITIPTSAVAQRVITVTAAAKSKTYGDADPALTYTSAPALVTGDSFSGSLSRSPGENVGTYAINQGTLALNGNYTLTYISADLTIGAKTVTVTAAAKSKTYGDADPALTYTFAPTLVGTDTFTGSLTRSPGENVGTYAINQGTLALNGNYTLTYIGADLTIGAKTVTVTAAAKSKTFGDADPALTYTFAPALVGRDTFTGSLTRSPGENVGTYAINQGTLALNGNYTLTYIGADLMIGTKTITVTAAAKAKIFGDADPALTYTFAPVLQPGDAFTGSLTRQPGENVGTYAINQGTLTLNGNYTLTYVGADLTIGAKTVTVTAAAKSKTYGDADPALTYTFAPALIGTDTFTGSLTRSPGENVGTYAINQGTLALNGNYTLTYVGADLTIGAKTVTVTAAAKSKTYGDADPALTYTFSPALQTGDSFTGSLTRSPGENVDTYAINQGTLALNGNYTLTYIGTDLTIGAKTVTVTAATKSKTFGDVDPALTYTFAPALTGTDTFTGSLTRSPGENVGAYTINQGTLALNGNYTLTYIGTDLTIGAKTVTVTAAAKSKTYGDADLALTYTFAPALIGTDTFTGSLTRSAGENVGTYAINQGTLALNGNYTLTYISADLTIGAKTVTVTAAAKSKTYGDADPALTYTFAPALVGTDTFTGSLTRSPGENVGTYAINKGTLALNGNYTLTYVGADLTIGTKTITVTAAAKAKTFGDADPTLTYAFAPALVGTDTFTGSLTRSPGENVGTYAINQGTLALNGNYTLTYIGADLTIGSKTITVTAAAKSKTFGDADPALTYTFTPALTGTDTFTGSLTRSPGENVGTYAINRGTLALNGNYTLTYISADLTIGAKTVTVTAAAKSKTFGDADPALTYTFSPVLQTGDSFTGSLTRAVGENVGTYAINQGTLALSGNYTLTYVGAGLTIGAKTVTVTAAAKSKTYGDADPALTYTFAPTLVGTDIFTGSLTRSPGENVGTYAINQGTLALNGNYTLTYIGADLTVGSKTITVTAAAKSKTYGDADPALTYTFAPALTGTDTFTGSLTRSPGENVGTYAINQGTLALNGNYTLTYIGADLTIGAKTVTVTATAKSKTFGDADPALTYTFTPVLQTGDAFTGSLTRQPGENVGTYAINQGTLALNGNYTLTYISANLTIGAKTITVTAAAKSKTYGDADPALTYTFAPALTGTDTFTGSLTRSPGENVGTYAINQGTLALNGNYTLTYVGADLTIGAKTVTVTAAAKSKTYGDADPALTYTFSPALQTGDTFIGSLTRSPGENVGTYAINQGTLALNGNYTLTYISADLTIGAKTVAVTAAAKSKTYGDADPALTYTFAPALVGTDTFTGSLTRSLGENVGTYAINQGTLALNSNYTLTYVGANLTIGAKTITVTAAAKSKTFGDADPVLTYTFAPALVGTDTFTGSLTRSAGENIGTYAINQGTLVLNGNYTLTYVGTDLTIGAKTVTVTAAAKSKTYGDADPVLTYTFSPALQTGESFTGSLTRSPGENVGTYAINKGTLALSGNYTLTYVGADLTIGAKTITVTAAAKSKTFGDADPALTYTFAPALVGTDTFTGSLTRSPGENVGSYAINQGTLALNGNYTLTYVGASLTIGAKAITVTAAAKTKTFGDADPALTYTFAPALQTGDTFTGSLSRQAGEAVGTYAITRGTLALNGNYTLTFNGANLTITSKVITITAVAKSKTYGDADPALTYIFSPALPTGTIVTGSLSRVAGENAGTYAINQGSLTLSGNFTLAYIGADLTINKAVLTVSANNAVMCQSDGFPNFGVTYTGFKAGDTENSLGTKPTVSTTANRNVAGTYVLVPSNGGSDNYTFVYVNGSLVINALPQVNILSNNGTTISKGETAILTASGGTSYSWSAASGIISGQNTASLTVRPAQTTVYTIRVTNASGCSRVESITIQVAEDYKIVANNILTPNGDGINDTWIVKNIDMYPGNEVRIFDRNGREMYSKKSYDNSWDGTLRGIPLAEGTYYYIITYGPDKLVQKGFITIIRNR
jgi:gliding motility-associated-like protein